MGVAEADALTAEATKTCQGMSFEMGGQYAIQVICQAVFAATIWDTEWAGMVGRFRTQWLLYGFWCFGGGGGQGDSRIGSSQAECGHSVAYLKAGDAVSGVHGCTGLCARVCPAEHDAWLLLEMDAAMDWLRELGNGHQPDS